MGSHFEPPAAVRTSTADTILPPNRSRFARFIQKFPLCALGGVKIYHDAQCDAGCLLQIIQWELILDADTGVNDAAKRTTQNAVLYEATLDRGGSWDRASQHTWDRDVWQIRPVRCPFCLFRCPLQH